MIVTKKGKPTAVMLPYFEDNEQAIADYLEDYEMNMNREALVKLYTESKASGRSGVTI